MTPQEILNQAIAQLEQLKVNLETQDGIRRADLEQLAAGILSAADALVAYVDVEFPNPNP